MNTITTGKYMMATKANHQMGDISRKTPDICVIFDEDKDNYIGNWVTGYGFVGVKFPKSTTRELTPAEIEEYHGIPIEMSGMVQFLNLKDEDFDKSVQLTKHDGKVISGILKSPVKKGSSLYVINPDSGKFYQTSTIQSVEGNVVKTRNSTYTIEYV